MNRFLIIVCILISSAAIASAQPATPTPSPTDPCVESTTRATRAETKLKDWPAVPPEQDANTKLGAPGKDENRVVFMGDSSTDAWQNPKDEGAEWAQPQPQRRNGGA